jgi:hypothetical protein
VDPVDRKRGVTPILSNECPDKSSGRSVSPIGFFLDLQLDFSGGFDDRGLRGSDEKMRYDFTNVLPDWPLL